MISFMVLGGPRSATTWAANWLTTDLTLCLHDPLMEFKIADLEQMDIPGKRLGISCTASLMYPEWVNPARAKKVILYRDINEINHSLHRLGLVELAPARHWARIDAIKNATIFPYEHLFAPTSAQVIAKILGVPWDPARHNLLKQMRIEPCWRHLDMGRQAVEDLLARIREAR